MRTEAQVAADTIAVLAKHGYLSTGRAQMEVVCSVVGIDYDLVIVALHHHRMRNPPRPSATKQTTASAGVAEAEQEFKTCKHCGLDKPIEDFPLKTAASGKRKSWCRECVELKRDRYNASRRTAEGLLVSMHVHEGDAAVGMVCPVCSVEVKPGDDVFTESPTVKHVECGY